MSEDSCAPAADEATSVNRKPAAPTPEEWALRAVAGVLAGGLAERLARPLQELREQLAAMVDTIDGYVAEAPGPTPYPWKSLQALRQELANAYLLGKEIARFANDLQEGVAEGETWGAVDVNRRVETALNLARHHLRQGTEMFVDLGSIPPVRAPAGELVLTVAELILCCAQSAEAREGSALSVRTYLESGPGTAPDGAPDVAPDALGAWIVIAVSDNGVGMPEAAREAETVVGPVMARLGGRFDALAVPGRGSVFECRLPAASE